MSVRKIAGLAAAFALAAGLIGGGVSAAFTDSVSAKQNIQVGTFSCQIVAPSSGTIAGDAKSVEFTSPTIMSSLPGNAPFTFTVKNVGSIPQALTVSATALSAPWSDMLTDTGPVALPAGGTHTFAAGVAWTDLGNSNIGQKGSIIYTVNCGEGPTISAVVSGPEAPLGAVSGYGSPAMRFTVAGANWAAGDNIYLTYVAGAPLSYSYTEMGHYFGEPNDPTVIAGGTFGMWFQDNCQLNPGGPTEPTVGVDVNYTITAKDQTTGQTATYNGILPCGQDPYTP